MNDGVVERDYTGVATAELAEVYHRYADCDLRTFAARIDMDEGTLKQIVISQKYPFQGLATVDKIVTVGLGMGLNELVENGELTIIPARGSRKAARRLVEDTLVLAATAEIGTIESARMSFDEAIDRGLLQEPSEEEMDARINRHLILRGELAFKTPEQEERLRQESERNVVRARRKKEHRNAA